MFTHKKLVDAAFAWVLKKGSCGVAFKELYSAASNGEYPDVIGFAAGGHSVLIEVKVSRSDFLSDKKKHFRKTPEHGMGSERYYCCPTNLIKEEELPQGWGLIYVNEKMKPSRVHHAQIPNPDYAGYLVPYRHEKNYQAEHGVMYSALRRLFIKGYVKYIYDKEYNRSTTPHQLIVLNDHKLFPTDFSSPEIKQQLESLKQEIQNILDGAKIDVSKLQLKFN